MNLVATPTQRQIVEATYGARTQLGMGEAISYHFSEDGVDYELERLRSFDLAEQEIPCVLDMSDAYYDEWCANYLND